MRDELYINGSRADMDGGTSISLNYKSNLLTDISKIVSNNSYTIKLPKTANNLRIIECAHIPSAVTNFPYLKHAGTLVRDGVEIIRDANVVLLSVGEQIEIALSWGNVMNFDTLVNDGKSLQDLSYGMVAGVDYTNWVKQSVQTPQFPKIEYGFKDKETSVWYHPVVTVKWIMDKIASEYGITFEFPDDRVEMMERMKIPLLTRKDAQKQIDENTKIAMVSGFRQEQATFPTKRYLFLFSSLWQETFYMKLIQESMSYLGFQPKFSNLTFNLKFTCSFVLTNGIVYDRMYIHLVNRNNNEVIGEYSHKTVENLGNGAYRYTFEIDEDVEGILVGNNYSFCTMEMTAGIFSSLTGTLTFSPYATNVEIGDNAMSRFYYVPNLPDVKQVDFLKAIAKMLGVFAVPTETDHIKFVSFDTLVQNKSKSVDWSGKLLQAYFDKTPQKISYTLDNFAQHNLFKYKEDDDVKGYYDSEIMVESETLDYERDVIELPFAACDTKNGVASIPLYSYGSDGELEYDDGAAPRIVLLSGTFLGVFVGLEWNTLLSEYYSQYKSLVNRPRVIVEYVRLSSVELQTLDLTVPVYLSQYGSYWAVINVKTKENDVCEVKLLKM